MSVEILDRWLTKKDTAVGRHRLAVLSEKERERLGVLEDLRRIVRDHYVSPETTAIRLAELGAPQTAALLREHLPTSKSSRSGDFGEILSTQVAEFLLRYVVPIRRLRWKDGRDMALRGDDIVGISRGAKKTLQFLKGESKSRAALATAVINEAAEAVLRDTLPRMPAW